MDKALRFYAAVWEQGWEAIAELGKMDRFFLLVYILDREDAINPWLYDRCREVERDPDNHIDLWARFHYKSTIITFAGIIQEILKNPEITICILSFNNTTARKFLNQIKQEFVGNDSLKAAYPDVVWQNPEKESPRWSEEKGIILNRKSNPKESTVEGHGLVDGMPTGSHYDLLVYDDVVTKDTVTTPDMIRKVTDAWRLSVSLGKMEGTRRWILGTIYHFNDTYRQMIKEEIAIQRIRPATDNGKRDGNPVLMSQEALEDFKRDQGIYIFACQMLLDPVAEDRQGFDEKWVEYHQGAAGQMNLYLLVDPASQKKKYSDYSCFMIVGCGADENYYVLDIVRDRLNLTERADMLFMLHKKWRPRAVGYEKYGMQSDIEHFEDKMKRENYRFDIIEVGGQMQKEDRIRRLVPLFETGRMFLPDALYRTDYLGKKHDLVRNFIDDEFLGFPVATHDDMLDCLSRIVEPDIGAFFPEAEYKDKDDRYNNKQTTAGGWMSA